MYDLEVDSSRLHQDMLRSATMSYDLVYGSTTIESGILYDNRRLQTIIDVSFTTAVRFFTLDLRATKISHASIQRSPPDFFNTHGIESPGVFCRTVDP